MSRQIVGEHIRRSDLPCMPADQIVVVHNENTRLYEPDVSDLIDSFLSDGQLQPCLVRPLADGRVQLVAGYRRWLAAKAIAESQAAAGTEPEDRFKLAVVVSKMSAVEALDKNIKENDQRRNLSPIEYAHAIRRLRIAHGWQDAEGTQKLADLFRGPTGRPRSKAWVTSMEDLLSLSEGEQFEVHKHFVSSGEEGISQTVAQVLAKVPEEDREKTLTEARAASMKGKGNQPKNTSAGNARIKVRDISNAAGKTRGKQIKDVIEFVDNYFDGSMAVMPLHQVSEELLTRIKGYLKGEFTELQLDNTIMKIDGCLHKYFARYLQEKAQGKKNGKR
jgi:ParB/RepB/Spo0J family partition protein